MNGLQRLAAATALAGAGSLALAGAANASESSTGDDGHGVEASAQHSRTGLVTGLAGAGGELAHGVGGLVGGVSGAAGSVLGSDAISDVVDGVI